MKNRWRTIVDRTVMASHGSQKATYRYVMDIRENREEIIASGGTPPAMMVCIYSGTDLFERLTFEEGKADPS